MLRNPIRGIFYVIAHFLRNLEFITTLLDSLFSWRGRKCVWIHCTMNILLKTTLQIYICNGLSENSNGCTLRLFSAPVDMGLISALLTRGLSVPPCYVPNFHGLRCDFRPPALSLERLNSVLHVVSVLFTVVRAVSAEQTAKVIPTLVPAVRLTLVNEIKFIHSLHNIVDPENLFIVNTITQTELDISRMKFSMHSSFIVGIP